ncbi:UbiA prenyltransferase family-domain-containing protein [Lyophyllum atratum]|nr:UbiA prenyltransferase family-domain-containing protein [Lyophyllum atratum]
MDQEFPEKCSHAHKPLLHFEDTHAWHPYLELIRLEKPTGTKLMFWPFAWGMTLAAYSQSMPVYSYVHHLAGCLFGAFIVRSSACTVNDIFDRKIDACVERTKGRPIPSGRVSVRAAVVYLLAQYLVGIAFFYATMDGLAFAIYPLMKRVTDWPQAWLGLAMNFGFLTSWISVCGAMNYPLIATLMTGCWCWTMLYDTIYACQDKKDDVKAGVRSTALAFGSHIRSLLTVFAITFVTMFTAAGAMNGQGLAYYLISVGGMSVHLIWQFSTVDLDVPESCWRNFQSNGTLGWIIWVGAALDYLYKMQVFSAFV